MARTQDQKQLTENLVATLKAKYENTPEQTTTEERLLLMMAMTTKYLEDWDEYASLLKAFQGDVEARLRAIENAIDGYSEGKVDYVDMWDVWDNLMPDALEDMLQDLGTPCWDLLGEVYKLRYRLVEESKKDEPKTPEEAKARFTRSLEKKA